MALGRCLEALRHSQMNPSTYLRVDVGVAVHQRKPTLQVERLSREGRGGGEGRGVRTAWCVVTVRLRWSPHGWHVAAGSVYAVRRVLPTHLRRGQQRALVEVVAAQRAVQCVHEVRVAGALARLHHLHECRRHGAARLLVAPAGGVRGRLRVFAAAETPRGPGWWCQSVRRFLYIVSRHVNSTFDSKHGCKGGVHNAKSRSWGLIAPLTNRHQRYQPP